jgi:MFS family permease
MQNPLQQSRGTDRDDEDPIDRAELRAERVALSRQDEASKPLLVSSSNNNVDDDDDDFDLEIKEYSWWRGFFTSGGGCGRCRRRCVALNEERSGGRRPAAEEYFMIFLIFLVNSSYSITLPSIFQRLDEELGIEGSESTLGLAVGIYCLGQFISAMVLGTLANKYSLSPLVGLCLIFDIGGQIVYASSASLPTLLIARLMTGLGAGMVAASRSYIACHVPPSQRTAAMSKLNASQAFSFIYGPLVGAGLSRIGTLRSGQFSLDQYTAPAYVSAALSAVTLATLCIWFRGIPKLGRTENISIVKQQRRRRTGAPSTRATVAVVSSSLQPGAASRHLSVGGTASAAAASRATVSGATAVGGAQQRHQQRRARPFGAAADPLSGSDSDFDAGFDGVPLRTRRNRPTADGIAIEATAESNDNGDVDVAVEHTHLLIGGGGNGGGAASDGELDYLSDTDLLLDSSDFDDSDYYSSETDESDYDDDDNDDDDFALDGDATSTATATLNESGYQGRATARATAHAIVGAGGKQMRYHQGRTPRIRPQMKGMLVCVLNFFVAMTVFALFETALTPTTAQFGWGTMQNGVAFSVLALVSIGTLVAFNVVNNRCFLPSNDAKDVWLHMAGLVLQLAGCVIIFSWFAEIDPVRFLIGMSLLVSMGYSICTVESLTMYSKLFGTRPAGTMMGYITSTGSIARITGPIMAGYLYAAGGLDLLIEVIFGLVLVTLIFTFFVRKTLLPKRPLTRRTQ